MDSLIGSRNVYPTVPEVRKGKIKAPVDLASGEDPNLDFQDGALNTVSSPGRRDGRANTCLSYFPSALSYGTNAFMLQPPYKEPDSSIPPRSDSKSVVSLKTTQPGGNGEVESRHLGQAGGSGLLVTATPKVCLGHFCFLKILLSIHLS